MTEKTQNQTDLSKNLQKIDKEKAKEPYAVPAGFVIDQESQKLIVLAPSGVRFLVDLHLVDDK